jgi:tRNA-intron endonuclease
MAKEVIIKSVFSKEHVVTENSSEAIELYNKSRFGTLLADNRVQLSLIEALYLVEKKKIEVFDGRNKPVSFRALLKKHASFEKNFWTRYCVYKDMRDRGYIVMTALKFGADFRVYDRGIKPGDDHAKWILYPIKETNHLTWYDFAAKNRVAHSTKKRLLIGIVDEENSVTYYEIKWTRP